MFRSVQVLLLLLLAAAPAAAQDQPSALTDLARLAAQGSAGAQYALGVAYANGDSGAVDMPQAARWFSLAARGGSAEARRQLDFMREMGLVDGDAVDTAGAVAAMVSAFRIQVATVANEDDGTREWRRLQRRFPDILQPLQPVVLAFEGPDGARLFRVQGGPLDETGARDLCGKMREAGAGCFVIRPAN